MSSEEEESKKKARVSKAAEAKNPVARVKELLEQAKGDMHAVLMHPQTPSFFSNCVF